jgi:hypothetical protein
MATIATRIGTNAERSEFALVVITWQNLPTVVKQAICRSERRANAG